MLFALVCALVANVTYGFGTILQALGVRRASTAAGLDLALFARLARQRFYLAGLGLDAIGFVASLVALQTLPLFVVQTAIVGSVGVTALAAVVVFGYRLRVNRQDRDRGADHRPRPARCIGAGRQCGPIVEPRRLAPPRGGRGRGRRGRRRGRGCPTRGGGLTLAGARASASPAPVIAARALHVPSPVWPIVSDPVAIALVLYGVCGMPTFANALQRVLSVTAASAVTFSVETIVPSIVGFAALGDRTWPHFAALAAFGFCITVGASLVLARYTEPVSPAPQEAERT